MDEITTLAVYTFIRAYLEKEGYPPSLREIATGCFIGRSTLYRHLDRLETLGCLIRQPGQARSLSLTGKPFPPSF